jgi:hypothetical protein
MTFSLTFARPEIELFLAGGFDQLFDHGDRKLIVATDEGSEIEHFARREAKRELFKHR